jgi:putative CocE/NonD family hydrolase
MAIRHCVTLALAACFASNADGQGIPTPPLTDSALPNSMRALAAYVAREFRTDNRDSLLDVTFRLALVRGDYAGAAAALRDLRAARLARSPNPQTRALNIQFQILAVAKAHQSTRGGAFADAFASTFDSVVASLDDRTAALALNAMSVAPGAYRFALQQAISRLADKTQLPLADAIRLLRAYQISTSYEELVPLARDRIIADDQRRYVIERDIRVAVGEGATNCVIVMRPRNAPRLPALLEYTIYADTATTLRESRRGASNGYVAVTAFTRGKLCSDGQPVPYRHDGADAAAVIDWISKQTWSDGRVGMYSGSYEGFTQWAALKHTPPALKTILSAATNAPGLDTPPEGNIVWNFIYPWPFYAANNKTLDNVTYGDGRRWNRLNRQWYTSGRAYRDLDKIDGTPNPIFDEWISHDSYDEFWQALIPYRDEFARVKIPVLQTAGYYYGGPGADLYYFRELEKYNPTAEHYLVVGPWDHFPAQRGVIDALGDTASVLFGLALDPVARISLVSELRYQWFDYVFKGKPKPALLRDKVNYQLVGANTWKHAPSIAAMSNRSVRLYLNSERTNGRYRLTDARPSNATEIPLRVDLSDRADIDRVIPGGLLVDRAIDTVNAVTFASEPFPSATEIAGLFSGHLELVTNKKDFDFFVQPYELTATGEYRQLPPYQWRASFVSDLTTRRLLAPGEKQSIDFQSIRLAAHQMRPGSRLVIVLGVIKNPGQQINYGSGKRVIDETIADAGPPLEIRWLPGSYFSFPVADPTRATPQRKRR